MKAEEESTTVTLVSSEGEEFVVERKVAEQSTTITNALAFGDKLPIPLFLVNSKVLSMVIDYCKKKTMDALDEEWEMKHLKADVGMLHHLLEASNYLDIKPLLDLCCLASAELIKGKNPEEIRRIFNIVNDFTPEQEMMILREREWLFD